MITAKPSVQFPSDGEVILAASVFGTDRTSALAFAKSLRTHVEHVREAGRQIGVPEAQLLIHDDSKWSAEEFPFYARQFFGDKGDPAGFAVAWLNHQNKNPHHWEFWISRSGKDAGCLPMPRNYILEMVADWMGASMSYTGSWDMTEWLEKNLSKIKIHPETAAILKEILSDLGYSKQVENL